MQCWAFGLLHGVTVQIQSMAEVNGGEFWDLRNLLEPCRVPPAPDLKEQATHPITWLLYRMQCKHNCAVVQKSPCCYTCCARGQGDGAKGPNSRCAPSATGHAPNMRCMVTTHHMYTVAGALKHCPEVGRAQAVQLLCIGAAASSSSGAAQQNLLIDVSSEYGLGAMFGVVAQQSCSQHM